MTALAPDIVLAKSSAGIGAMLQATRTVPIVFTNVIDPIEPAKLYPCTNCGMVPLTREVAAGKLKALGAGAALVRKEL